MEQITRPWEIWSSVASIFASNAGLRKLGFSIAHASRTRSVTAPIAVISVNDSSGPSGPALRPEVHQVVAEPDRVETLPIRRLRLRDLRVRGHRAAGVVQRDTDLHERERYRTAPATRGSNQPVRGRGQMNNLLRAYSSSCGHPDRRCSSRSSPKLRMYESAIVAAPSGRAQRLRPLIVAMNSRTSSTLCSRLFAILDLLQQVGHFRQPAVAGGRCSAVSAAKNRSTPMTLRRGHVPSGSTCTDFVPRRVPALLSAPSESSTASWSGRSSPPSTLR